MSESSEEGTPCRFCDILAGKVAESPGTPHNARLAERILWMSDHFVLISCLFPVTEMELLLIPRTHELSFANLPVEYSEEIDTALALLRSKLGCQDYLLFEHGSGHSKGPLTVYGQSILHAHLQIIPLETDVLPQMVEHIQDEQHFREVFDIALRKEGDLIACLKQRSAGRPYLFIHQAGRGKLFLESPTAIPSQFLRRISAEAIEGPGSFWDWKKISRDEQEMVTQRRKRLYDRWFPS